MLTTRGIYHAAAALLLVAVSGCVLPEVSEVRCTRDPKTGLWTVAHTTWNWGRAFEDLYASGAFDSVVTELTSPPSDSGIVRVIEHVFWEQGDSLCARSVTLATRPPKEFHFGEDSTGTWHVNFASRPLIMATNGTVTSTNEEESDSNEVVIHWPAGANEIYLQWRSGPLVEPFSKEERAKFIHASRAKRDPKAVKAGR